MLSFKGSSQMKDAKRCLWHLRHWQAGSLLQAPLGSLPTSPILLQMALFCSLVFFLWLRNILLYIHAAPLSVPLDGYFSSFHILAIVNSAAMNTELYVFGYIIYSPGICKSGLAGSYGSSYLTFKGTYILFSIAAV